MQRRILTLFFVVLWMLPAGRLSAQVSMEGGARSAAMGGATTALTGEVWGYTNPASWATLPGRAVSFFATEAFGLSELRLGAVHYAQPFSSGTFALGARTFGFEAFRETHFNLGFARGFRSGTTRSFNLGLNLRYHRVSIPVYGEAGALGIGLGGLVSVLSNMDVGFQFTNLHRPELAEGEELPRTLAIGVAYAPLETVRVVVDAYKDVRFPVSVRGGVEVQPVPVLYLRAGGATKPARFSAGAGFRLGRIAADIAGEHHEVLGWSPAVSFGLQW